MNDTIDNETESSYNGSSLYNSAVENPSLSELSEQSDTLLSTSTTTTATESMDFNLSENLTSENNSNQNMLKSSSSLLIQSERNELNRLPLDIDSKSLQTNSKTIHTTEIRDLPILEKKVPTAVTDIDDSKEEDKEENELIISAAIQEDTNKNAIEIGNSSTPITSIPKTNSRHNVDVKVPMYDDIENENAVIPSKLSLTKKAELDPKEVIAATASTATLTNDKNEISMSKNIAKTPIISPPTKRESIIVYDTIEEFESNLPPTVTMLETPFGSKVYLVGTAHFSEESQDDVSYVIRNVRPDFVVVELCPSRIHILKLDEKTLLEEAKNFNASKIRSIFQTHGYVNGFFFILFLHMSAQIAKELGMAPGGEFRRAFEEIHNLPGCVLQLGDRPINITLQRALRALSLWQIFKLVWRLTSTESITIEEVETCKERDLLSKLMQEMAGEFPAFSDVFVKERDLFLCHSLQLAAVPVQSFTYTRPVRVVGVVGIGHISGIVENWGRVDPSQIPIICEIPPASMGTRICKYTFKYGLLGLLLFGTYKMFRPRLSKFF